VILSVTFITARAVIFFFVLDWAYSLPFFFLLPFYRPVLSRFFVYIIRAPPIVGVFILNDKRKNFPKETSSTSARSHKSEVQLDDLEVRLFYLTQFPSG